MPTRTPPSKPKRPSSVYQGKAGGTGGSRLARAQPCSPLIHSKLPGLHPCPLSLQDNPSARPSRVKNRTLLMESSCWIRDLAGRHRDPHLNVNQSLCSRQGRCARGAGQAPSTRGVPSNSNEPLWCLLLIITGRVGQVPGRNRQAVAGMATSGWTQHSPPVAGCLGWAVGDTLLLLLGSQPHLCKVASLLHRSG